MRYTRLLQYSALRYYTIEESKRRVSKSRRKNGFFEKRERQVNASFCERNALSMHMQIYVQCGHHVLVAMRRVLARTDGQDAELRLIGACLDRAHLGVVKHPVALLREERHVHREALRRAVTLVPQRLLRLHEVLHAQQRSCQEISRCVQTRSQLEDKTDHRIFT